MPLKGQDRQYPLDCLRVLATFAVMILHIAAQNWYGVDVMSFEWNVFNFYDSMVRWTVPVFVMISGALFLDRDYPAGRIYRKKILRIVTAFIFWSLTYAVIFAVLPDKPMELEAILVETLKGHYHLWFLFIITGLYMVVPFLKAIVQSDALTKYFLTLSLIFVFIIPHAIKLLSLNYQTTGALLNGCVAKLRLTFIPGYSGYFILGYVLNRANASSRMGKAVYAAGLCAFLLTPLLTFAVSAYVGNPNEIFYNYLAPNILLESVFVFLFAKKRWGIRAASGSRAIRILSKYSFGAYLFHALGITILERMGLNTLSFNPLLSVPIIGIIVFATSFAVSAVFNHIPILRDYVV